MCGLPFTSITVKKVTKPNNSKFPAVLLGKWKLQKAGIPGKAGRGNPGKKSLISIHVRHQRADFSSPTSE
jgi:hypothetical protein